MPLHGDSTAWYRYLILPSIVSSPYGLGLIHRASISRTLDFVSLLLSSPRLFLVQIFHPLPIRPDEGFVSTFVDT